MRNYLLLFIVVFSFFCCSKIEKKEHSKTKVESLDIKENLKISKQKEVEKPWDSLNRTNFEAFLQNSASKTRMIKL